ncbi:MAG: RDD family protein [Anaerolineaceae bacterium]
MHDSVTSKTGSNSPVLQKKLPVIASMRRRFFAFALDSIFLGLIALVIGRIFAAPLSNLGPYGHPLGYLFYIPYFGLMNSKICNGQTLGKKIFNIAVRNKNNKSIGLGRSLLHTMLFGIPLSLSGLSIPLTNNPLFFGLANVLMFGLAGVFLYTLVFNRATHQGFNDMLFGTYVVNLKKMNSKDYPKTSTIFYTISACWFSIVTFFYVVLYITNPTNFTLSKFTSLNHNNRNFSNNSEVFSTNVKIRTTNFGGGDKQLDLIVDMWVKGDISYDEKIAICQETLIVAFKGYDNIETYDNLKVNIITGYDIGIAKSINSIYCTNTIPILKEWIENNTSE